MIHQAIALHEPLRLIIAHSHVFLRVILQNIFQSHKGFIIVGEVTTAASLVAIATELQPQVIIAEIALPGMEDTATLQQLSLNCKKAKVIISWGYGHHKDILNAAMATVYSGYVIQDAPPSDYFFAIKEAMKGSIFYCSQTEKFRNAQKNPCIENGQLQELSSKKYRQVIYCMSMGYSSKETAMATSLTVSTVNTYRKKFNNFLGSRSSAALANFMKNNGMM